MPHSRRFVDLQAAYRGRNDWSCLPELLAETAALTGSASWREDAFSKGILLYGAGAIGAGAFEYFTQQRVGVLGFIDDTPGKAGQTYCGLEVLSLESAMRMDYPIVISVKLWASPATRIVESGRACEAFSHHVFRTDLNRLTRVANDFLFDYRSRLVYLTIIKANILADYSLYGLVCEGNQYWALPEFQYMPDPGGVMVDAGSYVVDTVEEFVWRSRGMFRTVHAFEPDPRCFRALEIRAERLRREWGLREDGIRCVAAGLGERDAELPFFGLVSGADGSFLFSQGQHSGTLQIRKLDDYLGGSPITYLKADVEGYEVPLIRGSSECIKTHRPKLAICIYHRMTDLSDIPVLLHELVPDYKMAVRHHSLTQEESVLYCWR